MGINGARTCTAPEKRANRISACLSQSGSLDAQALWVFGPQRSLLPLPILAWVPIRDPLFFFLDNLNRNTNLTLCFERMRYTFTGSNVYPCVHPARARCERFPYRSHSRKIRRYDRLVLETHFCQDLTGFERCHDEIMSRDLPRFWGRLGLRVASDFRRPPPDPNLKAAKTTSPIRPNVYKSYISRGPKWCV